MSDFEAALMHELYPLRRALTFIAATLERGKRTHPDDDGFQQPPTFHIERAIVHLERLKAGAGTEHRLEDAATSLLMALQAR